MKFVFSVLLAFAGFMGVIFAFYYFSKKLNLSTEPKTEPTPPSDPRLVYLEYKVDYENFSTIVFELLKSIARRYGLRCPYDATGTYAARIADRVRVTSNNCIVFSYELTREPDYSGLHEPANTGRPSAAQVAQIFEQDLPSYLAGGYYFTGKVKGWDIDAKTIRIEIYGICRQIINLGNYGYIGGDYYDGY